MLGPHPERTVWETVPTLYLNLAAFNMAIDIRAITGTEILIKDRLGLTLRNQYP
jgi:hypothetical protein